MTLSALAVRHVAFEDAGTFAPVLEARGFSLTYLDACVDEMTPEAFVEPDLLLVMGGPIGVHDEALYPFLAAERQALRARLELAKPTIGVCLGAQLIADIMGASVRSTGTKEIGYGRLSLTESGRESVLASLDGQHVFHWHGDEFTIPAGGLRLAETQNFPYQAFSLGDTILALQFHLEADYRTIERWLVGHTHELSAAGIEIPLLRIQAGAYGPKLARLSAIVLNDWLDQAGFVSL